MNDETKICYHCNAETDRVNRLGLCDECAEEYAREFWADLQFEDARCS